MSGAKRMICFVLLYLGFVICVEAIAQQASNASDSKTKATKAQLTQEEKDRAAQKIKDKRESADKAKREAAVKAKAQQEEKARLAKLDAEARKEAKTEIAQAKRDEQAKLAELDAKAKQQTKEIKTEEASLKRKFAADEAKIAAEWKQAKAKAKKDDKARIDAEYKETLSQFETLHKNALVALKEKADSQTMQIAQQKKQIEADCREKIAKTNIKLNRRKEEARIEKLTLPEDTTPRLTVKELRISGNTLIATAELLKNMPLVYNASDKPLSQAESQYLYDFRILYDVILQPGQSRQVSSRTIQGFTQYILSIYRERNYAGIYVYVPAAAVRNGVQLQNEILPIEVLEAKITGTTINAYDPDQKKVEKGYLSSSAIQEWSPIKVGQVANQKKLDDFVNLLNLNPDRYVSAVVTKGAEPNSLAVGYDVYEANPWHYFIQVDNSGTEERQWAPRIGLINTNLLGVDDTFTAIYQAPWDSGIDENYSLYGSYDFPLMTPRLRLNLYGGYSEFDVTPAAGGISFLGAGSFYGGTLRYNVYQTGGWFFDVTGSLSHERSRVTPSLFPSILETDINMDLWGIGVEAHRSDDMSNTSLVWNRVESMGGSSKSEFTLARTDADPHFAIYTTSANHSQYLDPNKIQRLSGTFQWITSDKRLVPAKMTTFGGMYTVRGYDEYEVVADGGVLLSGQYEFDLVKYDESKEIGKPRPAEMQKEKKPWLRKLAPLAFVDYGWAKIKYPKSTLGEKAHQTLLSIGVGTLLELGDNFSGGVYYGYPLRATEDTRRGKGRVNVGLMLRW
jgi:hemolysin activation/secretion protein